MSVRTFRAFPPFFQKLNFERLWIFSIRWNLKFSTPPSFKCGSPHFPELRNSETVDRPGNFTEISPRHRRSSWNSCRKWWQTARERSTPLSSIDNDGGKNGVNSFDTCSDPISNGMQRVRRLISKRQSRFSWLVVGCYLGSWSVGWSHRRRVNPISQFDPDFEKVTRRLSPALSSASRR